MSRYEIIINNKLCYIDSNVKWNELPRTCIHPSVNEKETCVFQNSEDSEKCDRCVIQHCCKHVINGSEDEKKAFNIALNRPADTKIPDNLLGNELKDYQELSEQLWNQSNYIGICFDTQLRAFCFGNEQFTGWAEYFGKEQDKRELSLVSCFFKNTDVELYCLLYMLDAFYNQNKKKIPEGKLQLKKAFYDDPALTDAQFAFGNGALIYGSFSENRDFSMGSLRCYCYQKRDRLKHFYDIIKESAITLFHESDTVHHPFWSDGQNKDKNKEIWKNFSNVFKCYRNIYDEIILAMYLDWFAEFKLQDSFKPEYIYESVEENFNPSLYSLKIIEEGYIDKLHISKFEINLVSQYLDTLEHSLHKYYKSKSDERSDILVQNINFNRRKGEQYLKRSDLSAYLFLSDIYQYIIALWVYCRIGLECCIDLKDWGMNYYNYYFVDNPKKENARKYFKYIASSPNLREWNERFRSLLHIKEAEDEINKWFHRVEEP